MESKRAANFSLTEQSYTRNSVALAQQSRLGTLVPFLRSQES